MINKFTEQIRWRDLTERLGKKILYNSKSNVDVLDVGAGDGSFYKHIKNICKTYTAMDPFVEINGEIKKEKGVIVNRGFGECLPYKDNMFDVVVFNSSLDHCFDAQKALNEANRVLRDCGLAFFLLANENAWYKQLLRQFNEILKQRYKEHNYFFTPDSLRDCLSISNFKYLEMESMHYLRLPCFMENLLVFFPQSLTRYLLYFSDRILGFLGKEKGGSFIAFAQK